MALGCQIVYLVRLHFLHDADEVAGITQVTVVQNKVSRTCVRVLIEMVNAVCVEERGATLDAVYLIALAQQKFCQIGSVLTGDTCYKRFFHDLYFLTRQVFIVILSSDKPGVTRKAICCDG